jgi:hypothetical protein
VSDRGLSLVEPDGSALGVVLVTAGTRAGLPSATFEVDFGTWDRVESHGLLHVDPARSRGSARPFDEGKPVHIEAVLDPVAAIDGIDALADRLLAAHPGDPLLSTEAWWSLSATQDVDLPGEHRGSGSLQEGVAFEHPIWLRDAGGSVGLEEAWQRALDVQDRIDSESPLLDLIIELFEEQEWQVDRPNPEATVIHAGVASDAGDFDLYVRTDEDRHHVTAMAVIDVDGSEDHAAAVCELAARLNTKSPVGSYEADADSGLLAFKVAIDVTGDRLSSALARGLIGAALIGGERANALYRAVLDGSMTPADAALNLAL